MLVLLFVILASARLVIGQVSLTIIAGIAGIAIFTRRRLMACPLPQPALPVVPSMLVSPSRISIMLALSALMLKLLRDHEPLACSFNRRKGRWFRAKRLASITGFTK